MTKRPATPTAHVARLTPTHEAEWSAVLVPRHLGHLAVQLFFHRHRMHGVEVRFFRRAENGAKGPAVGDPIHSDHEGVARLPFMVEAGTYVCEIERQPPALVSTVPMRRHPVPVVLPVGRPYVDLGEGADITAPALSDEGG